MTRPELPTLPFAEFIGVRVTGAREDLVEAVMTVTPDLCTGPSQAHGGAIMALADTVGALATAMSLPEGWGTTTLESKTNFLRAAPVGSTVRARATPLHRGRRTQVWTTRIEAEDGRLIAVTTQTQMLLPPSPAP
jgi:1,4-dihydroxy-2-naphthoyl-CoA hydrolase